MKKNVEISKHVDLLDEAYRILYYWVNVNDLEGRRIEFMDNYQSDLERYNKRFEVLTNIYQTVTELLQEEKNQIEYYFKERNAGMSTLGALAILLNYHKHNNDLVTYEERVQLISKEEKVRLFAMMINGDEAVTLPTDKLGTVSDLIAFIETSPFDNDAKWEVIKIFHNQESHYNNVSQILTKVMEILIEKYSFELEEMAKEFYGYWSKCQESESIITLINDRIHVTWNDNEVGTVVVPQIFDPFGISISVDDSDRSSKDVIRLGIILDKRIYVIKDNVNKVDIINFGKMLSDKSKVDIIEYISKKPAYGKEIANEMNLSTATISHHLSALAKLGIICEEVKANRIYYSINKEQICSRIDDMKKFFVNL